LVAGITLTLALPDAGTRIAGIGLLALAAWLAGHDLPRRTVRTPGAARFIALSLLAGYVWMAVAGVAWLFTGASAGAAAYDVRLHALLIGFVISMVFGHAPAAVSAVLRVPLPYSPAFYGHLALLHAGLLLRVVGGDVLLLPWAGNLGGVMSVAAVLLFVAVSAAAAVLGLTRRLGIGPARGELHPA
ncbi:MAG TPA: hypothetical protein VIK13_11855, partial [Candidatus Limnocylindrales bacterium]